MGKYFLFPIFFIFAVSCTSQPVSAPEIHPGAYQMDEYLPIIKNKKVGLFVNHTSIINQTHLTDTLMSRGVNVTTVFSPEHGFKGNLADGEIIVNQENRRDFKLISLYGKSKKPADEDIRALDILIIDIQDVGVRFYTYASTMTYLMEACAKNEVPVIILDRPNPNGSYIAGPVLDERYESFIGLHPIPLVHGLTMGELARMINGEGWLETGKACRLQIIKVRNWHHNIPYSLPIPPSPNLPNALAVSLYPSLGLFEGTIVSVGRGTDHPFQVIGHPAYEQGDFSFVPQPNEGSKYPPLKGEKCEGVSFVGKPVVYQFTLKHLLNFYQALKGKTDEPFFNDYFEKLTGNEKLRKQIEAGMTEEEIFKSWEDELNLYGEMRKKYLLYAD